MAIWKFVVARFNASLAWGHNPFVVLCLRGQEALNRRRSDPTVPVLRHHDLSLLSRIAEH